jgi:transposase-like protein
MEDKEQVEKTVKRGGRTGPRRKRYTYEEKLRAVKLHVEEGFNAALVCQETGVSPSSLGAWLAEYRKRGEVGLKRESAPPPGRRQPGAGGGSWGCRPPARGPDSRVRWWRRSWS